MVFPMLGKNTVYYLVSAGIIFLLKLAYSYAGNEQLIFLLKPVSQLIGFLTGSSSVYSPDEGYYLANLNIVIDKSCSGFNFWLISFAMLVFTALKHFDKHRQKLLVLPIVFIVSYLLAVFVNTSRIYAAIIVQNHWEKFLPEKIHFIVHQSVGIITSLVFLVIIYYLTNKILTNKQVQDEKFT